MVVVIGSDTVDISDDGVVVDDGSVDIAVVGRSGVMMMVVVLRLFGAKITNFNTKERAIAKMIKMKKHTSKIITQRRRHHLGDLLSPVTDSLNT